MVSEQELAEMEERHGEAVLGLKDGGRDTAFRCVVPIMTDMPRLIAEVRRLKEELEQSHEDAQNAIIEASEYE